MVENARESRQGKDGNHAFASGVRHESVAERRVRFVVKPKEKKKKKQKRPNAAAVAAARINLHTSICILIVIRIIITTPGYLAPRINIASLLLSRICFRFLPADEMFFKRLLLIKNHNTNSNDGKKAALSLFSSLFLNGKRSSNSISSNAYRGCSSSKSFSTVSPNNGGKSSPEHHRRFLGGGLAALGGALAYYSLPTTDENDENDRLAKDPRDDRSSLTPHEKVAKLHSFLGDENRILARAKPLKSSSKVIHFGLFSDGEISRKEKRHSVKKESGETIVLNVPDAYIVSASTAANSDEDLGEAFTKMLDENKIDTRQATQMFVLAQKIEKRERVESVRGFLTEEDGFSANVLDGTRD